jgi:hypothetical protein
MRDEAQVVRGQTEKFHKELGNMSLFAVGHQLDFDDEKQGVAYYKDLWTLLHQSGFVILLSNGMRAHLVTDLASTSSFCLG